MGRGGRGIQLTPEQSIVVAVVVGAIVVAVLVSLLLEAVIGRGAGWLLRLFGVRPPAKSPARLAIEELEARVRGRDDQSSL